MEANLHHPVLCVSESSFPVQSAVTVWSRGAATFALESKRLEAVDRLVRGSAVRLFVPSGIAVSSAANATGSGASARPWFVCGIVFRAAMVLSREPRLDGYGSE
jgi:hypothetical protein